VSLSGASFATIKHFVKGLVSHAWNVEHAAMQHQKKQGFGLARWIIHAGTRAMITFSFPIL
jgi:hypothetical protein